MWGADGPSPTIGAAEVRAYLPLLRKMLTKAEEKLPEFRLKRDGRRQSHPVSTTNK